MKNIRSPERKQHSSSVHPMNTASGYYSPQFKHTTDKWKCSTNVKKTVRRVETHTESIQGSKNNFSRKKAKESLTSFWVCNRTCEESRDLHYSWEYTSCHFLWHFCHLLHPKRNRMKIYIKITQEKHLPNCNELNKVAEKIDQVLLHLNSKQDDVRYINPKIHSASLETSTPSVSICTLLSQSI